VDDHDGAASVMGALLADGTEQQPGKPTVPTRSHDQQIALGGGAD
jgi:hypothetical protein